jgi:hypothetical protein
MTVAFTVTRHGLSPACAMQARISSWQLAKNNSYLLRNDDFGQYYGIAM